MILRIFLLILLAFVIVLLVIKYSQHTKESFSNYFKCLKKGFTKHFCVKSKLNPDSCICENGNVGRIVPGLKGKCVCGSSSVLLSEPEENEVLTNPNSIPSHKKEDSFLKNFEYKRGVLKGSEDVIPFSPFGNFSFF